MKEGIGGFINGLLSFDEAGRCVLVVAVQRDNASA